STPGTRNAAVVAAVSLHAAHLDRTVVPSVVRGLCARRVLVHVDVVALRTRPWIGCRRVPNRNGSRFPACRPTRTNAVVVAIGRSDDDGIVTGYAAASASSTVGGRAAVRSRAAVGGRAAVRRRAAI